jgi:cysteine desulfurase/selenocysteine lyase
MAAHEDKLLKYAAKGLSHLKGVELIGTASEKVSVQSFTIQGIHPFDVGQMLDARGVAVRTGHHCTQPLMDRLCIEGTVRASFAVYNTKEEIDRLLEGVDRIIKFLK